MCLAPPMGNLFKIQYKAGQSVKISLSAFTSKKIDKDSGDKIQSKKGQRNTEYILGLFS